MDSSLDMPSAVTGYNATTGLGLTGPFTPLAFPVIRMRRPGANSTGGLSAIGPVAGFGGNSWTRWKKRPTFVANLTWVKNNHTFKFGGEAGIEGYPNSNFIDTNGSYNFSAAETGLPYLNATGPPGTAAPSDFPMPVSCWV